MSYKFWDLPQKYKVNPLDNKGYFLRKRAPFRKSRNGKCFFFWLNANTIHRKQKNYFSFCGDQLLENAV